MHPFVKGHGDLVCCNNDENADRQQLQFPSGKKVVLDTSLNYLFDFLDLYSRKAFASSWSRRVD